MTFQTILDLYCKEREYQNNVFGQNKSFNVASFLEFIEIYLEKAKKSYVEQWNSNLPTWLLNCKEMEEQHSAPIETYAYLIKVMALVGQALELFSDINPEEWRKGGEK
jgi:hypothetical protein